MSSVYESQPLLRDHLQENRKAYDDVLVKNIDEEHLIRNDDISSSSSQRIIDEHDTEYIVQNRLGNTSLAMITFCISLSGFLAAVDTSIVTTIFNEIGTEFKSSNLSVWIMTSYMLSTSALQPLYGKLSDIFGRKSTLVSIVCFFLVGSWLCGIADTMFQMSIARLIAGLGGGGIMTMGSVVIHDLIPMRKRGQYQSYVNMAHTVGTTIGAPLGGIINDYFGWRYCFYINLPPCLFILYIYLYKLENYNLVKGAKPSENIKEKLEKIDFIGAALLLIGNISFVTGASLGGNLKEWNDPVIIALLTSTAFFFILFGVYEFNWAKYPLVSRTLIQNRNVVAVCLNNFFLCSSTMAFGYLIPQYFMVVLGYDASSAGLWSFPRAAMVTIGCFIAGNYLGIKGRYKNLAVSAIALQVLAAFATYFWTESTPMWYRLMCMNVEGFCFGVVFVATMVALVADITHAETASATSMIFLCRSTGWLSGSTITAAILQTNFKRNLTRTITGPEAAEIIEFVRTSITKIHALAPKVQVVILASLEQAIRSAFGYGVVCAILCFLTAIGMRNCQLGATITSTAITRK